MRCFLLFLLCALCFTTFSLERDFSTPEKAMLGFFPGTEVEVRNIIITRDQKEKIEKIARTPLRTRLISIYIAKKGNRVVGYGYVDVHRVRTHNESVLIAISPEGEVVGIEVLSFNEPLEYMADENWLALFKGKSLDKDQIRLGRDIPNMTGATLTARVITKATRRALAIWKVLYGGKN
jgi:Na+-translocating ferredoxin:NAD+ oxidoreductase RnfG subunit